MLTKCANPSCSTPLVYLREGKIFMMEAASPAVRSNLEAVGAKSASRVEHFWLCGPCSSQLTLAWDSERGIQVVPKDLPTLGAAAS
jgi:hypothetical protein